jgi:sugar O-acyltransferase (sialic acid O-acetyltransferase NeuD family)
MNEDLEPHPLDALVYGGGGHGKMVIEILRGMAKYRIAGLIDDGLTPGTSVAGVPVLGGSERLAELHASGIHTAFNAVAGVGNIATRVTVFERLLKAGFALPALAHPAAYVEATAHLADGAQLFAHSYAGSDAQIGFGVILSIGVCVPHDCVIGEYTNISPGTMLAGMVTTGLRVLIGMNATINIGLRIGDGARIGNGATIKKDVPAGTRVRAGHIWPE